MKKNIVILGSNNNAGIKAFNFFKDNLNKYSIFALSYDSKLNNIDIFIDQIEEIKPKRVFVVDKDLAKTISEKTKVDIYVSQENFPSFIKSSQIDEVVSALSGITSVKKILSAIYEFKDITLINTSPLLYCGKIIVNEVKSKGVKLNVFSYPLYSLDLLNKLKQLDNLEKIYLFSKKQDKKEKLSIFNFDDSVSYMKKFYSINKIRVVNDIFLINYIYSVNPEYFTFFNQTERFLNLNVRLKNGTGIIFTANLDIYSIYNYYFLGLKVKDKIDFFSQEDFSISFSQIDVSKEKYLQLGIKALKKGGSCPIIYYITLETLLSFIYFRKIKENINIFSILEEFVEDKTLYHKYPDLSSVCAIEQTIINKILKKYSK